MRINGSRLLRLMLAGGFAGMVIFFVFNPALAREEEKLYGMLTGHYMSMDSIMQMLKDLQARLTTPDPFGSFMFTGTFAAMVGSLLVIVDEMSTVLKRVLRKILIAAIGGMIIGGIIGVGIDFLGTRLTRIHILLFPVAQLFLFPLIGFAAGLSVGLSLGSRRRLWLAMGGGLVGGIVGGMVFQMIGSVTGLMVGTGSIGRFLSFISMGAIIGLSVAFVEEAGKKSWVVVLNGPKEGRQYILSKRKTTIGKDELADIPLFGDPSVKKDHAYLDLEGYLVKIVSTSGEVSVNGSVVQSVRLQPRDDIQIGHHRLRFHQKGEQRAMAFVGQPIYQPQPFAAPIPSSHPGYVPAQTSAFPVMAVRTLVLTASSGPHTNQVFQFPAGSFRIGRETDCAVFLPSDTVVSRNHAELTRNGAAWIVRDLGSRHGLWINGVRVTEHTLNLGDQIGVGQTWLRVDGI